MRFRFKLDFNAIRHRAVFVKTDERYGTRDTALTSNKPIIGMRFGRLIAVEVVGRDRHRHTLARCICDCGRETIKTRNILVAGDAKSCGCLQREAARQRGHATAVKARVAAGIDPTLTIASADKMERRAFDFLSAEIKRRDDFTCFICRERGVRLQVHHIVPWVADRGKRLDPANLMTLCRVCHLDKVHGGNVKRSPVPLSKIEEMAGRLWTWDGCAVRHVLDLNPAQIFYGRDGTPSSS